MKYLKPFRLYESKQFDPGQILYHGTPSKFTQFSDDYLGRNTNHEASEVGFHFTDNLRTALSYSKKSEVELAELYKHMVGTYPKTYVPFEPQLIRARLNITNPLYVDYAKYINDSSIEYAKENGYDGIVTTQNGDILGEEYCVFSSDQIQIVDITPIEIDMEKLLAKVKK